MKITQISALLDRAAHALDHYDELPVDQRQLLVDELSDAAMPPMTGSVLQEWVMDLPLREQGTLLTGVRSCDVSPKVPLCINEKHGCSTGEASADRQLVAYLRWLIMVPADEREVDYMPGAFMQSEPPADWKPSQFGHYPLHWFSHVMHGFQIVGVRHPEPEIRHKAEQIYLRMVHSLHLNIESDEEMIFRLGEDRIASGTVVS